MEIISLIAAFLFSSPAEGWVSYKSTPQVDVFYMSSDCHDEVNGIHRNYLLLKFVNKTSQKLIINWQYEHYEGTVCKTCNKPEYAYSLTLLPNQTIQANCGSTERELKVFVKHLDLPNSGTFTHFEMGNFTVWAQ
jgi:hypothetical protein